MAHRTEESSELLYWCKPCRDVTLHNTLVNNNARAVCTVCASRKNIVKMFGAEAYMIAVVDKQTDMERQAA